MDDDKIKPDPEDCSSGFVSEECSTYDLDVIDVSKMNKQLSLLDTEKVVELDIYS